MLVAIQNGHYDVANYLVDKGADVNLANDKGWNPLYLTVKHRNIETGTIPVPNQDQAMAFIQVLLDHKVNVNPRVKANTEIRNGQRATWLNEAGATPFLRAALCGDAATAAGARRWNDANVLVLSNRLVSPPVATEMLDAWFATDPDPSETTAIASLDEPR